MDEYQNNIKTGHPILGLLLGLLGIAAALVMTFFIGVVATVIAVLFGGLAIFLGITARKARRGGRGIAAIVAGALAILLSLTALVNVMGIFSGMHNKAVSSGQAPLVAQYSEKSYLGLIGLVANIPTDEGSIEELMKEIELLNSMSEE